MIDKLKEKVERTKGLSPKLIVENNLFCNRGLYGFWMLVSIEPAWRETFKKCFYSKNEAILDSEIVRNFYETQDGLAMFGVSWMTESSVFTQEILDRPLKEFQFRELSEMLKAFSKDVDAKLLTVLKFIETYELACFLKE